MNRPKIIDFYQKEENLDPLKEAHKTYSLQPNLFKYVQALDGYVDHLEKGLTPEKKEAIEFAEWIEEQYSQEPRGIWFIPGINTKETFTTYELYNKFLEERKEETK